MDKKQFTLLSSLATHPASLSQRQLSSLTGYALGSVNAVYRECARQGYLSEGAITPLGLDALEPYRVKRAIFLAAGFSARLAPITFNTPKPLVQVNGTRIIDGLIDACLALDIKEIYVVRGYLAGQFDQLLAKYPMVKFLENPAYNESNNITSAVIAKEHFANAYVFEADLLIRSPNVLTPYHWQSDFLAVWKGRSDDWCFTVDKKGIIQSERMGGFNTWQMVGISYWSASDGTQLAIDLPYAAQLPGGKEQFWEQVPLSVCRNHYQVALRPCSATDIREIDTFRELKAIDPSYEV